MLELFRLDLRREKNIFFFLSFQKLVGASEREEEAVAHQGDRQDFLARVRAARLHPILQRHRHPTFPAAFPRLVPRLLQPRLHNAPPICLHIRWRLGGAKCLKCCDSQSIHSRLVLQRNESSPRHLLGDLPKIFAAVEHRSGQHERRQSCESAVQRRLQIRHRQRFPSFNVARTAAVDRRRCAALSRGWSAGTHRDGRYRHRHAASVVHGQVVFDFPPSNGLENRRAGSADGRDHQRHSSHKAVCLGEAVQKADSFRAR